eukprot:Nk52_evm9s2650 gene=Nk52_evmTU9s2650
MTKSAGLGGEEKFQPTQEEINQLTKAMQEEEFRKMFFSYVEEISDPKNRALYEEEIRKMEAERGVDARMVHPLPGFVVKTQRKQDQKKVFVNISHSREVQEAYCEKEEEGGRKNGGGGGAWKVPYSLAEGREDVDKSGENKVVVYDVVFHPQTLARCYVQGSVWGEEEETEQGGGEEKVKVLLKGQAVSAVHGEQYRRMVISTALDGINERFGGGSGGLVETDMAGGKVIVLKNKRFWGQARASIIRSSGDKKKEEEGEKKDPHDPLEKARREAYPYGKPQSSSSFSVKGKKEEEKKKEGEEEERVITPVHTLIHSGTFKMSDHTMSTPQSDAERQQQQQQPKELVLRVNLPGVMSIGREIELDITAREVQLKSTRASAVCTKKCKGYQLVVPLPYPVDCDASRAKFDKSKHVLRITMPTVAGMSNSSNAMASSAYDASLSEKRDLSSDMGEQQRSQKASAAKENENEKESFQREGDKEEVYCAEYDYRQTDELVAFVFDHAGIVHEDEQCEEKTARINGGTDSSVRVEFEDRSLRVSFRARDDEHDGADATREKEGDKLPTGTGPTTLFRFVAVFYEAIDIERCYFDVSPDNLVVILVKKEPGITWYSFKAGQGMDTLVTKQFKTLPDEGVAAPDEDAVSKSGTDAGGTPVNEEREEAGENDLWVDSAELASGSGEKLSEAVDAGIVKVDSETGVVDIEPATPIPEVTSGWIEELPDEEDEVVKENDDHLLHTDKDCEQTKEEEPDEDDVADEDVCPPVTTPTTTSKNAHFNENANTVKEIPNRSSDKGLDNMNLNEAAGVLKSGMLPGEEEEEKEEGSPEANMASMGDLEKLIFELDD